MRILVACLACITLACGAAEEAVEEELVFRHQELERELGIGYAVLVEDIDGDGDIDVVALNETQVAWWSNPEWTKQVVLDGVTEADNVAIAAADITGDDQIEFAIGAAWRPSDTEGGGTLQWIERTDEAGAMWKHHPLGNEPTTHRMRWADTNADGDRELIVAPLHGRGTSGPLHWEGNGVRLLALTPSDKPIEEPWDEEVIDDTFHIVHNFWVGDFNNQPGDELLVASYEGVHLLTRASDGWTRTRLGTGFISDEIRGAGEITVGSLESGKSYIVTVEPWHSSRIVRYDQPDGDKTQPWDRRVVVENLGGGHALWAADVDKDGDDEIAFGWRLEGSAPYDQPGVAIYDPTDDHVQIVDLGGMATEDLKVVDLNEDGLPDIVASGRSTHNLKIYWNEGPGTL